MKKSLMIIAASVAMIVSWNACTQNEETGKVQFGLELKDDSALKSAVTERDISEALVSISGENGEVLYDKEPIKVYAFGGGYVTESLELPVGGYALTEFMLINSAGEVVWATPREGSSLAHLVRKPLPVHFRISQEQTTSLDIQVIRVGYFAPDDFGYVNFNIGFVERFCLQVFYSSRCPQYWGDSILSPEGFAAPIFQSMIIIYAGDRVVLNEPLNPGLNHYQLPPVNSGYLLTATDCLGMVFYERMFMPDELAKHRCQDGFPPLVIHHADPEIIITPEGLYEPTIKQGVFGGVILPIDGTDPAGNTDNTDVYPVIRDIYFFPYAVMDSIYTFAPVDCYFPGDLINMDPVAIVRTNSNGIFQLPLAAGPYLYLVREEFGFYIDAYISSHLPGYVMVYPEEVTELWINVIDCSLWQ